MGHFDRARHLGGHPNGGLSPDALALAAAVPYEGCKHPVPVQRTRAGPTKQGPAHCGVP